MELRSLVKLEFTVEHRVEDGGERRGRLCSDLCMTHCQQSRSGKSWNLKPDV